MKKNQKKLVKLGFVFAPIILLLIVAWFFINHYYFQEAEESSFELNTVFLKIAMNEEGTAINNIKIKNTGDFLEHFSIKIKGIGDLTKLDEDEFNLNAGEEKTIQITFDSRDKEAEVYLGELEISSGNQNKKIPVILEIQSKEVLFDSNINLFPQGEDITPGQKLNAEIKIFDLASIGREDIKLIYFVKSFDGRTIVSESEDLVVDGRLDYSKTLDLPLDLRIDNYVMYTVVKHEDSVGISSVFFNVVEEKKPEMVELANLSNNFIIYIFIFGFFFLVFLGLFVYSFSYGDRLLMELKKQYKRELKKQKEKISARARIDKKKLKNARERKEYKEELAEVRRQRLNAIKEIHKERLKQIKEIEKSGKKELLEKQIKRWKEKGYKEGYLEAKYKFPRIEEIRDRLTRKLGALEEARREGIVSRKSYEKGKKRIKSYSQKIK